MADIDLKEILAAATEMAPGLRKAGIKHVRVGEFEADLEPYYEEPQEALEKVLEDQLDENEVDPWDDPSTYGEGGGHVPGFSRLRNRGKK